MHLTRALGVISRKDWVLSHENCALGSMVFIYRSTFQNFLGRLMKLKVLRLIIKRSRTRILFGNICGFFSQLYVAYK